VDQTLVVNGQPLTIVGVAPEGFRGTTLASEPDVFVPLTMRGVLMPNWGGFDDRRSYWAYVFGRLGDGVTLDQARVGINSVYAGIVSDVEAPLQEGMTQATLERFRSKEVVLREGARGQSSLHEDARTPLILLLSITGMVLLIACANIANLLLVRGAGRSQEMAVRSSLGATRGRLMAQLLTEAVVLAVLGGVASLVVARLTLGLLAALLPPEIAPIIGLGIRPEVVIFAGVVAVGTGIAFGLFPAFHNTRREVAATLRSGDGRSSGGRAARRFRSGLVTAQMALSMALLVTSGLFIRSLANVSRVDLGLEPRGLVTFAVSPELNGYDAERIRGFFDRLEEELAAVVGVRSVSAARVPLLAGSSWGTDVAVQGFPGGPDVDSNARFNEVGAGYFETVGMTLVAGRTFTSFDGAGAPPVAVVNEAFARKFGLGREAVGRWMGRDRNGELDMEIVGMVADAGYNDVKEGAPPLFFTPWRQNPEIGALTFYVRTQGDPDPVLRAIPDVVGALDPNLPVEELKTLEQQIRENVFVDRLIGTMSTAFALLATLLAAVGLYGVLASTVARRTREIGLRMALGADASRVRAMVVRQVLAMAGVGAMLGAGAALAAGRAAGSLLYGLEGHDPVALAVGALFLAVVAGVASYLPVRRASRVDPMSALRYE
jgi:predicted permease